MTQLSIIRLLRKALGHLLYYSYLQIAYVKSMALILLYFLERIVNVDDY